MKVLITGGAGFIGRNLVPLLKSHNVRIRVLDIKRDCRKLPGYQDLEVVEGDIRDKDVVTRAVADVDAVIHLAAHTRVIASIEDPVRNFDVNARGTLELLMAMRQAGVTRIINASTSGALLGEAVPPVHENMPARPISPYGASKLAAEAYLDAFAGSYGFRSISLRFSNVYGLYSEEKTSAVALFMRTILEDKPITIYGDGTQVRDFVFAGDVCFAIKQALYLPARGVFHIGAGAGTSINTLLEAIKAAVHPAPVRVQYAPARVGEIATTYCDIARASQVLDYRPKVSLRDGIAKTWTWFKAEHEQRALQS